MRFLELKRALEKFILFSLSDIKSIEPSFHRRRLNEWQEKGYIRKIIRGYYIFRDINIDENILFQIANKIYSPSYISFEAALSYYDLIPESVYGITSATTRRTYIFNTEITQFRYHTFKKEYFFGYQLIKHEQKVFKIASIEKAVIDHLYIHSDIKTEADFINLRFNPEVFSENINKNKLYNIASKFLQKSIVNRIDKLIKYIKK